MKRAEIGSMFTRERVGKQREEPAAPPAREIPTMTRVE